MSVEWRTLYYLIWVGEENMYVVYVLVEICPWVNVLYPT